MTAAVEAISTVVVKYDISEAQIAAARAKCELMACDTPKGYEEVRVAIADLRDTRVKIEKRRVELKADALAYGRLVDSEAKRYTTMLFEIEEPLKAKKQVVDDEKDRVRREAEVARQRELEAKVRSEREAEEARLRAEREAEEARLAEERARLDAERAALAEERRQADEAARIERQAAQARREAEEAAQRAEGEALRAQLRREREAAETAAVAERALFEAEQARQQAAARAEREALDAERRAVAAEREQAERAEFERQARIKAEADAVQKAEADRLAAAERQARLDALKPDIEKARAFAKAIRQLAAPKARTKAGQTMIAEAVTALEAVAVRLDDAAARVK